MSQATLFYVAIIVFMLMLLGLALTVLEFRRGAPKEQIEDPSKIQDSPHGHA